jgi:hypothetical protein
MQEIRVFSDGYLLELKAAVRRLDEEYEQWIGHPDKRLDIMTRQSGVSALPNEFLRVGVQFADGKKATNIDGHRFRGQPDGIQPTVDQPLLLPERGRSRGGTERSNLIDVEQCLWLWPIPQPRPFELVIEWPAVGIPLTRHPLDGQALADSVSYARPYW